MSEETKLVFVKCDICNKNTEWVVRIPIDKDYESIKNEMRTILCLECAEKEGRKKERELWKSYGIL